VSGTAPARIRRSDTAASTDGPDAEARRVLLPPGSAIDPFALAGAYGVLMADTGRILVGVGTAVSITLPGGLADPAGVDRALAELAALGCDDRLPAGITTLRPRTRCATVWWPRPPPIPRARRPSSTRG
jgi:hypothetical protein